jgi:glutaredoxin-related protein
MIGSAMARKIFNDDRIHPAVIDSIGGDFEQTIDEVEAAVASHKIVVVGMASNPHCKGARKLLDEAGLTHHYLEYGSYFKQWKRRGALKMWLGWQTFPMVFVDQQFIGGRADLQALLTAGAIKL